MYVCMVQAIFELLIPLSGSSVFSYTTVKTCYYCLASYAWLRLAINCVLLDDSVIC